MFVASRISVSIVRMHRAFDRSLLRIGLADAVKKCQLLLLKVLPSV